MRHPAHGDILAFVFAALGQGDIQRRRGSDRIIKKQLVKIPHAVKQQRIRVARLDIQILRHHRGYACFGHGIPSFAQANLHSPPRLGKHENPPCQHE